MDLWFWLVCGLEIYVAPAEADVACLGIDSRLRRQNSSLLVLNYHVWFLNLDYLSLGINSSDLSVLWRKVCV